MVVLPAGGPIRVLVEARLPLRARTRLLAGGFYTDSGLVGVGLSREAIALAGPLSALLGHSSVTTTQRYTHMSAEDLREQVAGLPGNR